MTQEEIKEKWYLKVQPLVEKMKARFPQDLEGLEPALTSEIADIVLALRTAELEGSLNYTDNKMSKEIAKNLGKDEWYTVFYECPYCHDRNLTHTPFCAECGMSMENVEFE